LIWFDFEDDDEDEQEDDSALARHFQSQPVSGATGKWRSNKRSECGGARSASRGKVAVRKHLAATLPLT